MNWIYAIFAAAIFMLGFYLARRNEPRKSLLEQFMAMKDNDQMQILAVVAIVFATSSSLLLMGFIFWTKTFDPVVISMASTYITMVNGAAWSGYTYWYQSSHGSRAKDKAMATATLEEVAPSEELK